MSQRATVTSKGQVTIPIEVRKALGIRDGDQVLFEVNEAEHAARVRRAPDFLAMAGTIPPRRRLPKSWEEERRIAVEEALQRGE